MGLVVFGLLAPAYRLPLAWLDWSGARSPQSSSSAWATMTNRNDVSVCSSTTKTRQALWIGLPDALAGAIEATLPPREDREHPCK
jgi:hypothetical protein